MQLKEKLADELWVAPRSFSLNFAPASRAGAASEEQKVRFPLGRTRFGFLFLGPERLVFPVAGEPGLGLCGRFGVTAPAGQITFLKPQGERFLCPHSSAFISVWLASLQRFFGFLIGEAGWKRRRPYTG